MPSSCSLLSPVPEGEAGAAARCRVLLNVKMTSRGSLGRLDKLACRLAALTDRPSSTR